MRRRLLAAAAIALAAVAVALPAAAAVNQSAHGPAQPGRRRPGAGLHGADHLGRHAQHLATGRKWGDRLMCDTAARFDLRGSGMHRPLWVNWTGGDSLYSVADTGAAVYVGGHQRWMDNPQGHETAGPGAVARPGIAAIDPVTGKATAWNPKREPPGAGARALLATPQGLLVGSDTDRIGGEYHGRLALLPLG